MTRLFIDIGLKAIPIAKLLIPYVTNTMQQICTALDYGYYYIYTICFAVYYTSYIKEK